MCREALDVKDGGGRPEDSEVDDETAVVMQL